MTAVVCLVGVIVFFAVARWLMCDEHFADPPPSQLRRRQLDDLCERDRIEP